MDRCMACGKTSLLTTSFGNVILCKNCGSIVNVSAWRARNFESMDALVAQKNDVLQKATAGNLSEDIIAKITRFFDEYIEAGFITTIDGKAGQTLKVFADQCIITTKSESKQEELKNTFHQFAVDDNDDEDNEALISSDDMMSLAKGLMSGKFMKTGINVAISTTYKQREKERVAEKKENERRKKIEQLITVGERRVFFNDMEGVEVFSKSNTSNGYLRFIPRGVAINDLYSCEFFFFNNSIPFESKRIKQRIDTVKNVINERIAISKQNLQSAALQAEQKKVKQDEAISHSVQQNKQDAFEEIRKFKQLLDEGIISEEEFNIKKKQLLGL